jgi:hypothetical protein
MASRAAEEEPVSKTENLRTTRKKDEARIQGLIAESAYVVTLKKVLQCRPCLQIYTVQSEGSERMLGSRIVSGFSDGMPHRRKNLPEGAV